MTEEKKQRTERGAGAVILLLGVIIILCAAGLILCYAKARTAKLEYSFSGEALKVVPGNPASVAHIAYTAELPEAKKRQYALIIHDVVFIGTDLTFADMNEGQWEYSTNGSAWTPLVLSKGERVIKMNMTAGQGVLLLRAADNLDVRAAGGSLDFKLKLRENRGHIDLWILFGILVGSVIVLFAYPIVENRISRRAAASLPDN